MWHLDFPDAFDTEHTYQMHVFIVKLRGDHYFIGRTLYPPQNLNATFSWPSNPWMVRFPFEGLVFLYPVSPRISEVLVNHLVAKVMVSHGINSVRGGEMCDGRHYNIRDKALVRGFLDDCLPQMEWDKWVTLNLSCSCTEDCGCYPGAGSASSGGKRKSSPLSGDLAGQFCKEILNRGPRPSDKSKANSE